MGLFQNLRDKYLVAPVAKRILDEVKPIQKANTPDVFQVPVGFNSSMSNFNKRMAGGGVDWPLIRQLSINHETTRGAINTRKRQITSLGWDIVDIDDDTDPDTTANQRQTVREKMTSLGGPGVRFRSLLDKLIEDTMVLDALVFYKQRDRAGRLLRIIPIDGTTIKLRVDQAGARPLPPDIAFEQWIRGEKVAEMTTNELTYEMMNPRTDTPYGLSPIESLVLSLDGSMRAMLYNLAYLSDNSVPQGFMNMPDGWSIAQIKEYTEYLHAMINGPKAQAKIYPIPSSSSYQATSKPTDFAFQEFFDYLDRRVCMLFDITPQELGLNLKQYKENAEGQERIQVRKGIRPLVNFLQEIFTDIIRDEWGYKNFAFKFVGLDGKYSPEEIKTLLPVGVLSIDEVRNDMGLSKLGVNNYVIAGNQIITLAQLQQTTISGANLTSEEMNVIDPSSEDPDAVGETTTQENENGTVNEKMEKKLQKIARNVDLDKVEAKPKYKQFRKAIETALKKQIEPFTKESTIDRVLKVNKSDSDIEDVLDDEISSVEINGLTDYLSWSAEQGGNAAYQKLGLDSVFKPNPEFQKLIDQRQTYLINSVDSTTKEWLFNIISTGKEKGITNADIARQIAQNDVEITKYRANMIVNTEVANAMQQAELNIYKSRGIQKKVWVLSEDIGDECGDNADQGAIDINDTFVSGNDAPPAHPNCRCFIQAVIED